MSKLDPQDETAKINETLRPLSSEQLCDWLTEQLYLAFAEARKNKTKTVNEQLFEENRDRELYGLAKDIINRTYTPARSVAFIVTQPTTREIIFDNPLNEVRLKGDIVN